MSLPVDFRVTGRTSIGASHTGDQWNHTGYYRRECRTPAIRSREQSCVLQRPSPTCGGSRIPWHANGSLLPMASATIPPHAGPRLPSDSRVNCASPGFLVVARSAPAGVWVYPHRLGLACWDFPDGRPPGWTHCSVLLANQPRRTRDTRRLFQTSERPLNRRGLHRILVTTDPMTSGGRVAIHLADSYAQEKPRPCLVAGVFERNPWT
jgi:hypothetical protein